MKKLLLLSILALGMMTAKAQSTLSVTVAGQPVANGATVDCTDVNTETWEFKELQLYPHVMATSTKEAQFDVTVENTSTIETDFDKGINANILFCCGGNCVVVRPGQSYTKPNAEAGDQPVVFKANTPFDLEIDSSSMDIVEEAFTLSCKVTIVEVDNPSNNFWFNLNMVYDPDIAAVDGIAADDAAPVYYNLNGVKVANPDHGIFIVKKGAKVSKVVL